MTLVVAASEAPPEKAMKYHEALLKRPHNAALFDRFFNAWLDEQSVGTMEDFLTERAKNTGTQEWVVLARYQLRRGQEDAALESLAKAEAADPSDFVLPMEMAKLQLKRMEFAQSRESLAKVIAGSDKTLALEASKFLGKAWLREGKMEEAVRVWDGILAAHPGDEELLEDLVEVAAMEGEASQALAYVEKLIAASKDPYQKTLRTLRRGDLLVQAGRIDDATEAYATALEQVGEGSWLEREVLAQIEKLFRSQDRIDDLQEELKKLAEAHPRRLLIHQQLARLEISQGEVDVAIGRFREVLQRSPGDRPLREEFIKLLVDGERLADASTELEKLIATAPGEAELYLQLAGLRHRQQQPEAILAALKKAQELLGGEPGTGIRIAGLMFQYQLNDEGEVLLKQLAEAPGAEPTAVESLAAHYGRTNRKPEAIELLKKLGASGDVEVMIRAAASISGLGESGVAFEVLRAGTEKGSSEPHYLSALVQTSLAAGKAGEVIEEAVKLVRMATQTTELGERISLALRVIAEADQRAKWREGLQSQSTRTIPELCLLAALTEEGGDIGGADSLLFASGDPMAVHFHAALLDRRGDLRGAIAALSRLADTEEGRKAAYFKDLAGLQERAGLIPDALATVERWKLGAPGDKTAWIVGSRLLRESGKPEEAVKMARQAASRFEEDTDLVASLGALYEEAGQWQEAEDVYWRLYDGAQTPADQARWAVLLGQLAMRMGQTTELEEKLRQRARGNKRSVGPILALSEVARLNGQEEKRRDLLLEAIRLQPKDVDLRLQIANLEDQLGNPDRVVALLEEALSDDTTGKIRSALAQAYIRQGQPLKGLRELRAMSGKQAHDPRNVEESAATLAGASMYEEAIQFLKEELPDGGDWRTRYLLAILLEEDGREAEAVPLLMALLHAEGDLPGSSQLTPSTQSQARQTYLAQLGLSKEAETFAGLVEVIIGSAYAHRNQNRRSHVSGSARSGRFMLPLDAANVRLMAAVHLAVIADRMGDEKIANQARAAGVGNFDLIQDLAVGAYGGSRDYLKVIDAYFDQPGVLEWTLFFGGRQVNVKSVREALGTSGNLSPFTRFQGWIQVAREDSSPEVWAKVMAAAKDCVDSQQFRSSSNVIYFLGSLLEDRAGNWVIPDEYKDEIKTLVRQALKQADFEDVAHQRTHLIGLIGTPEEWLAEINASIRTFRKPEQSSQVTRIQNQYRNGFSQLLRQLSSNRGGGSWGQESDRLFAPPTLEELPLLSIPVGTLLQLGLSNSFYGREQSPKMTPGEILKKASEVESPLLLAWVALRAGDEKAIAKYLHVTPSTDEASDFNLLLAAHAIQQKKPADAFEALLKARYSSASDREYNGWLNASLIGIAHQLSEEERNARSGEIQSAFLRCRQVFGPNGGPLLASQATSLGLNDLAARLQPPTPHLLSGQAAKVASTSSNRSSRNSGNANTERISKLQTEGKYEAAAKLAIQNWRLLNNPNSGGRSYEARELLKTLGEDVQREMLKIAGADGSMSLVKRMEYVDLCAAFKKPELALPVLKELYAERPHDGAVLVRYVLLLSKDQRELQLSLLTKAALSEDFSQSISDTLENMESRSNLSEELFDLMEMTCDWLEREDPDKLAKANLTWASYHGKNFFRTGRSLLSERPAAKDLSKEDEEIEARHVEIGKRLALAMLRHPGIAEEGFRLLCASKAWQLTPEERDEKARQALASADLDLDKSRRGYQSRYFTLIRRSSSSSSGGNLGEFSSVSWLIKRLKEGEAADIILPPVYLAKVSERNAELGKLVASLKGIESLAAFKEIMESEVIKLESYGYSNELDNTLVDMLRRGLLEQAANVKGVLPFLLESMADISAKNMQQPSPELQTTVPMVIHLSAGASEKDRDTIARTIGRAYYGEKVDWKNLNESQQLQNAVYHLRSAFDRSGNGTAIIRLAPSFFRLGIPIGSGEDTLLRPFYNKKFATVDEAEAYFEEIGWLGDVQSWSPVAGWMVSGQGTDSGMMLSPMFLNDRAARYFGFSGSKMKEELIARLKNRKKGRFGSLMTAATLSREKEREALAGQAFSEFSKEIAKLSPARVEEFYLVVPWLPSEVRAKLPSSFQRKVEELEKEKRAELLKRAESFLAEGSLPQNNNRPFDVLKNSLEELKEVDFEKWIQVFLAAEQIGTRMSSNGSRRTYSDLQIPRRDSELEDHLDNINRSGRDSATTALRFLAGVEKSSQGGRFAFFSPGEPLQNSQDLLTKVGRKFRLTSYDNLDFQFEFVSKLDKDIQPYGRATVFGAYMIYWRFLEADHAGKQRALVEAKRSKNPALARCLDVAIGVVAWEADSQEKREETLEALHDILSESDVPSLVRLSYGMNALSKRAALMEDPRIIDAIASLYEEYCSAERSAVNPMSIQLFKLLISAPQQPSVLPALQRINRAFWANANTVKPGGHPDIPGSFASQLYVLALIAGDEVAAGKLKGSVLHTIVGDVPTILALLKADRMKEAATLLPGMDRSYQLKTLNILYDKDIEQRTKAFGVFLKDEDRLRFECRLAELWDAEGKDAPVEAKKDRASRLAAEFVKISPTSDWSRLDILSGLCFSNSVVALEVEDALIQWASDRPYSRFANEKQQEPKSSNPYTSEIGDRAHQLYVLGALLAQNRGDSSLYRNAVTELDRLSKMPKNSHEWRAADYYAEHLCSLSAYWVSLLIAREKTDGFEEGARILGDLAVTGVVIAPVENRRVTEKALGVCLLMANQSGHPEIVDQAVARLPDSFKAKQRFKKEEAISPVVERFVAFKSWKAVAMEEDRRRFVKKLLTQSEFAGMFHPNASWLPTYASLLNDGELEECLADPDTKWRADVAPVILHHRALHQKGESTITLLKEALAACEGGQWKPFHSQILMDLINRLIGEGNSKEARELLVANPIESISEEKRKDYKKLSDKLAKAEEEAAQSASDSNER